MKQIEKINFIASMEFSSISPQLLQRIREICGEEHVFIDNERLKKYGRDETEDLEYLPQVVARPYKASQIAKLLQICKDRKSTRLNSSHT